jgi:hypothetical protein
MFKCVCVGGRSGVSRINRSINQSINQRVVYVIIAKCSPGVQTRHIIGWLPPSLLHSDH